MEAASFLVHRDRLVADDGFTFFGCIGSDSRTLSKFDIHYRRLDCSGGNCVPTLLPPLLPSELDLVSAATWALHNGAQSAALCIFVGSLVVFFYAVLLQDNYSNWGAFIFAGSIFTLCVVVPSVIARSAMI